MLSSRWNETRSATNSDIKLFLLQNATTWFLGQGKLNHHDTQDNGLQKQSYHKPGNILWPFDFSIDFYKQYGSFMNKSTELYLKQSQWFIVSYPAIEFNITTTDHCVTGKEMLSKNGNPCTSMICECSCEHCVHFINTQDPGTEILKLLPWARYHIRNYCLVPCTLVFVAASTPLLGDEKVGPFSLSWSFLHLICTF